MTGSTRAPYLAVGRILAPHGLRGEVKVASMSDFPARFAVGAELWVEGDDQPCRVVSARRQGDYLLIQLDRYADRSEAELLRNRHLVVPRDQAMPLPDGEYYSDELVGIRVITALGQELGVLVDIWWTGANEVYVLEGPFGEVLLPATAEVVQDVDLQNQRMVVELIPGLIPELDETGSEEAVIVG